MRIFPLIAILILLVLVFEVYMFVHAVTNKGIEGSTKMLWLVGMLLIHPFVAIVYYFTDFKKA